METMAQELKLPKAQQELLPWDLSEWTDREALAERIDRDLGELDWTNPELLKYLKANPAYRPRMMLILLTLAFATKIYDSESIVRNCDSDKTFRSICGDQPPTVNAVSRFRRENRSLLKWCLVQLFKRAIQTRFGLDDSKLPSGLKRYLVKIAIERVDTARHMDRGTHEL
jgi:transposase